MAHPRLVEYADLLVNYSLAVRPGDLVAITSSPLAMPLLELLVDRVARAGAYPFLRLGTEATARAWLLGAPPERLAQQHPAVDQLESQFDCLLWLDAPENTRALQGVPPERLALAQKARQPLTRRVMANTTRWCRAQYPTAAVAQDAGMALSDYQDFLFGACLVDWPGLGAWMQQVKERFDRSRTVRIEGDGTDLTLGLAGRPGHVADGRRNMPDGEVFYAPRETETVGTIAFDFPALWQGREVEGIRLTFRGGRVEAAAADRNGDFLTAVLDTDPGARVLGEFGIGCNPGIQQFTRNLLFDEKMGGTLHLAVGQSYTFQGGQNQSQVHWDMVKDLRTRGRITCDGEVVQENGRWLI